MADFLLNYLWYIVILGTIQLSANEWILMKIIISIDEKYLKFFNCVPKLNC